MNMCTALEKLKERGRAEGRTEGLEEGRAEGKREMICFSEGWGRYPDD